MDDYLKSRRRWHDKVLVGCNEFADSCRSSDLSSNKKLLAAIIRRAIDDARGSKIGDECDYNSGEKKRDARKWLRERSQQRFGFGWVIDNLDLTPGIVERILFEAFFTSPRRRSNLQVVR